MIARPNIDFICLFIKLISYNSNHPLYIVRNFTTSWNKLIWGLIFSRIFYIKDCSPAIFMKFLRYLYVGYLDDIDQFSEETLADLMTIADRYEVT